MELHDTESNLFARDTCRLQALRSTMQQCSTPALVSFGVEGLSALPLLGSRSDVGLALGSVCATTSLVSMLHSAVFFPALFSWAGPSSASPKTRGFVPRVLRFVVSVVSVAVAVAGM